MNEFEKLVQKVEEAGMDALKFYEKGNKSAGVRLRKFMLDVKALAQSVRTDVVEKSK